MTLDELDINECAVVCGLDFCDEDKKRLRDMGLFEGRRVKFVFSSPFSWPRAYDTQGVIIAIRKEDAKRISIKRGEDI